MHARFLTYSPIRAPLFCIYCLTSLLKCITALLSIDVSLENQFILGGLFPIHTKGPGEGMPCGTLLRDKGIQRLEAMLYAIDNINKDRDYWKISLGATIRDTCSSDVYALEQSLAFLKMGDCSTSSISNHRVTAVVGAGNSPVSAAVASILRLFKISQVSYASTSVELSNTHRYPYFFRVVPPDKYQIEAIVDLIRWLGWSFISTVTAEGDYGERAVQQLRNKIVNSSSEELCFAAEELLPSEAQDQDYRNVINALSAHDDAHAVVVFLNEDKLEKLLAASDSERTRGRFLWLGSDSWGAKSQPVEKQEYLAEGAITILPKRFPIPGFDDYFLSLKPQTNRRNPWFCDFWESQFECTFPKNSPVCQTGSKKKKKTCTGNEDLKSVYKQEGLVSKVVDSVHVLAHALKELCAVPENCTNWDSYVNGKQLRDTILNVTFMSSQGNDVVVRFDNKRNVQANYTIFQFRKLRNPDRYDYVPIGEWDSKNGLVMSEKPTWKLSTNRRISTLGQSACSLPCNPGEERQKKRRGCCWTCKACDSNSFLEHPHARCEHCPTGEIPTANRTSCIKLEPDYMGSKLSWKSPWTLIPCIFSCFGILSTLVVLIVFLAYRQTPVIKAAGRELCYVMLAGVLSCYAFTFVVATKPTEISCGILRVGVGFGLSVCYSAIFTKTNRISRIFNRKMSTIKRPSYISPTSQLVICLCLVLIQLTITVMWLIIMPPAVKDTMMDNPRAYILSCSIDPVSVQLGLVFNMILVLMCTVYAYKTRHIPTNFNEAKYISFTMYSTCIVWLAFVTIYSSTWKDIQAQSTVLCMSVSMSGTVVLLCLFFPKLYIVLLKPEKNIHNPTTTSTSASGLETIGAVRFIRNDIGTNNR